VRGPTKLAAGRTMYLAAAEGPLNEHCAGEEMEVAPPHTCPPPSRLDDHSSPACQATVRLPLFAPNQGPYSCAGVFKGTPCKEVWGQNVRLQGLAREHTAAGLDQHRRSVHLVALRYMVRRRACRRRSAACTALNLYY